MEAGTEPVRATTADPSHLLLTINRRTHSHLAEGRTDLQFCNYNDRFLPDQIIKLTVRIPCPVKPPVCDVTAAQTDALHPLPTSQHLEQWGAMACASTDIEAGAVARGVECGVDVGTNRLHVLQTGARARQFSTVEGEGGVGNGARGESLGQVWGREWGGGRGSGRVCAESNTHDGMGQEGVETWEGGVEGGRVPMRIGTDRLPGTKPFEYEGQYLEGFHVFMLEKAQVASP
jgi:hypothetical protein